MRSQRNLLAAAGVLFVLGTLLVFVFDGIGDDAVDVSVLSNGGGSSPQVLLWTDNTFVGASMLWVASVLVAVVIGQRMVTRSPRQ